MGKDDIKGPLSYRNWKALLNGKPCQVVFEYPLFSDAHITGEIADGLGPYQIINAVPITRSYRPALVLRSYQYLESKIPDMEETSEENYHGGFLADEIAALMSLFLGIRIKSGDASREFTGSGDTMGRPRSYGFFDDPILPEIKKRPVLKSALGTHSLDDALSISSFHLVSVEDAIALIRAARLYQEAVWIVEETPELSWIMLASAVETIANRWREVKDSPFDKLNTSRPKLVEKLRDVGGDDLVMFVAEEIAPYMGATKTFVDFLIEFIPSPPQVRPDPFAQLSWETRNLRKILTLVYKYRSRALHGGLPFPAPMCEPPLYYRGEGKAAEETPIGLAASMRGGVWLAKDIPIHLHTFEYIVRNSIVNWWRSLQQENKPD
jgi:hypothetical protein